MKSQSVIFLFLFFWGWGGGVGDSIDLIAKFYVIHTSLFQAPPGYLTLCKRGPELVFSLDMKNYI